jgi:hypothetical protein
MEISNSDDSYRLVRLECLLPPTPLILREEFRTQALRAMGAVVVQSTLVIRLGQAADVAPLPLLSARTTIHFLH